MCQGSKGSRANANEPGEAEADGVAAVVGPDAVARGMVQLKGHRVVGGMRASIYNAMPIEGVKRLVEYMREFEAKYG